MYIYNDKNKNDIVSSLEADGTIEYKGKTYSYWDIAFDNGEDYLRLAEYALNEVADFNDDEFNEIDETIAFYISYDDSMQTIKEILID